MLIIGSEGLKHDSKKCCSTLLFSCNLKSEEGKYVGTLTFFKSFFITFQTKEAVLLIHSKKTTKKIQCYLT